MQEFLVCYDYGMGGLWWWITAPHAQAIDAAFKDVVIFDHPPAWWTSEQEAQTQHVEMAFTGDEALNLLRR
jgi:hypothetical protein